MNGNLNSLYPKHLRYSYFAHRFCRLVSKSCIANEIGPDAALLLMTIALTEDAKRYRGPVTFFNGQLMPLVGLTSIGNLDRARARAVASGWLHYEPGTKTVPGRYWVVIPEMYSDDKDKPIDEDESELFPSANGRKPEHNRKKSGTNTEDKRNLSGTNTEHIRNKSGGQTLTILPIPNPRPY